MSEEQKEQVDLNPVMEEIRGIGAMMQRFFRMGASSVPDTSMMMYWGPDKSLYAIENDSFGFPAHPIAEHDGKITPSSLKAAFSTIKEDTILDDSLKVHALRKILASHHALMFDDTEFESEVTRTLETMRTPEQQIIEDAKESLSDNAVIYEFAFSGEATQSVTENENAPKRIYRNILRTGEWKVSPTGNGDSLKIDKSILDDLVAGFQDGAFEYVSVPETHRDLPSENRGFIKDLEILEDPLRPGEYVLRGGFEFTNKEAEKAALEGSIAGVSCGIVFNHQRKTDGKLYNSALHHVALTNKPWIDGLGGWEKIAASQFGAEVVVGFENEENTGENPMPEPNGISLTQEQIDSMVKELADLKLAQSRNNVADMLRPYQNDKKLSPAVLKEAEKLFFAATLHPKMLTLSENNAQVEIDLEATVKAMLDAMPNGTDLSEPPVETEHTKPPTEPKRKSPEEQVAEIRELTGLKPVE